MIKCQKCEAELHEDQKVCIVCGTRTIRGDGFDYGNKGPWRPTKNMMIGAGVVVFLLLVVMIVNAFRVTPPEVVAEEWFDAMVQRQLGTAQRYVSPALESDLTSRNMDLRAVSDEYYTEVVTNQAKYQLSGPQMAGEKNANVVVALSYPDGNARQITIGMVKDGRRWLVESAN